MNSEITFLVIVIASFHCVSCKQNKKWDALKVRFNIFEDMPRTVDEALAAEFTKLSDCSTTVQWRGARYFKGIDRSIILLYDINGYIAGIQVSIPKNSPGGYPSPQLRPPFVSDGNFWVITAYFYKPTKICTTGRTRDEFTETGTGSDLYIQNSTNPDSAIKIHKLQKNLAGSQWTEGQCFPKMGKHYWWNLYDGISCNSLAPWFLLYNNGSLNGFGFAFTAELDSQLLERPAPATFQFFMKPVPACLINGGVINSLHVYLTSDVTLNKC